MRKSCGGACEGVRKCEKKKVSESPGVRKDGMRVQKERISEMPWAVGGAPPEKGVGAKKKRQNVKQSLLFAGFCRVW